MASPRQVTGVDLVEWMIRVAAGDGFELAAPALTGASIEARIYAEDPARNFRPSTGLLTHVRFRAGGADRDLGGGRHEVTPYYDPLLAKVIVCGARPRRPPWRRCAGRWTTRVSPGSKAISTI